MSARLDIPAGIPHAPERHLAIHPPFWRAGSSRSLVLAAIGAIAGLVTAGIGLFTAQGTAIRGVPPEDVALVNQRPILRLDFVSQLESLYGVPLAETTEDQRHTVLESMIREELFVQRGLELDFPSSDPDVRTALVNAVEQQVVADVAAQQATQAQLQEYYTRHADKYVSDGFMTVHDLILTPKPGEAPSALLGQAQAAVRALRSGAAVSEVGAAYGLADSGKTSGREFYFAAKIHLGETLFPAAAKLRSGEVSEPISDGALVHVIVMAENIAPVPLAFADAREQVISDYSRDAQSRLQEADRLYLREKADIQLAPDYR